MKWIIVLLICVATVACNGNGAKSNDADSGVEVPSDVVIAPREPLPPRPEKLDWGKTLNGLRMAAWRAPGETRVCCVIKNASDKPVRYCHYAIGHWQRMTIQVRPVGENSWFKLKVAHINPGSYLSEPGMKHHVRELRPEEEIRVEVITFDMYPMDERDFTFGVELLDYTWPTSLKGKQAVEMKIAAQLFDVKGVEGLCKGTLESQVMRIPVKDLEEGGCLLTGISGKELIKEYEAAGLALKGTHSVPSDVPHSFALQTKPLKETEKMSRTKLAAKRLWNVRREIHERGKEIAPLLMEFLKKEVPENRPEDAQGISPSFTRDVIDLLVRIGDPRPTQLLVEIVEGDNGTATKAERRVALDGLEKLTFCSFRKLKPHFYDHAVEHSEALDYASFSYEKAAKLYRKWLAGEGKTPRQWYTFAKKRAREILESDDIEGIYCAASFLAGYFSVYPDAHVRRDDQSAKTLKRLAKVIGAFENVSGVYNWKSKEIQMPMGNWIEVFTRYGHSAQPYAKMLLLLQKENPQRAWHRYLGRVGGREIMEFLFDSLRKLKGQELSDCRNAIDRHIGRQVKSDELRRKWWKANKHKYDKD